MAIGIKKTHELIWLPEISILYKDHCLRLKKVFIVPSDNFIGIGVSEKIKEQHYSEVCTYP